MKKHTPSVLTGIVVAVLGNLTGFAFINSVSNSESQNTTAALWLGASVVAGAIVGWLVSAVYHSIKRN